MNKKKIFNALSWSFIGTYGNQAVLFLVGVILARLLEPGDFGIIAMILVFSNFGQLLTDLGFSNAVIQGKSNTREDLSTVFFLNLGLGIFFCLVFFLGAPLLASFYNEARLVPLTRLMSLIFIFYSLSSIQRTLFIKKLEFKPEAQVILISSILSGTIAVFMALENFGALALAAKLLLQRVFETAFFWLKSDFRPRWVFKKASLKKYWSFSMNITAASLLNGLTQNIDRLIIGKLFSTQLLGFFDRARKYSDLARSNIANIFGKVLFPVFSEIQEDKERFIRIYHKIVNIICFFSIPFFLVLIIIAEPLVVVLITVKWLPSVKLLQILALSGVTYPLSMVMVKAIAAKGRADLFFQLDVVKTVLYILFIVAGSFWGLLGVVIAITIANFIGLAINAVALGRVLEITIKSQVSRVIGPLLTSLAMFGLLVFVDRTLDLVHNHKLWLLPVLGLLSYLTVNYLFNRKQLTNLVELLRGLKKESRD